MVLVSCSENLELKRYVNMFIRNGKLKSATTEMENWKEKQDCLQNMIGLNSSVEINSHAKMKSTLVLKLKNDAKEYIFSYSRGISLIHVM